MRTLRWMSCLGVAAAVWLSTLHVWFRGSEPMEVLADHQLELWADGGGREIAALRRSNPEWELMARMFAVLGLVNWGLAEADLERGPERGPVALRAIDRIVDEAMAQLAARGQGYYLLPYAQRGAFHDVAGRSLFVDGEIAMMLAARRLLVQALRGGEELHGAAHREAPREAPRDDRRDPAPWIARIAAQIERSPSLLGESYPDETWIFCNTVALAAIRLHDAAEGNAAHAQLLAKWVAHTKQYVVDHSRDRGVPSYLMISSTDASGQVKQGPEGSSLWLAMDMLLVIDAGFAREQYAQARRQLIGSFAGFSWAREWPHAWPGYGDIDSGPTVPLVGANAGSSGLALVAASAFGDRALLDELSTSLQLAAFPMGRGRYAAGNALADTVLFYARSHGPLWQLVQARTSSSPSPSTSSSPSMSSSSSKPAGGVP